jgi:hypothetical protein
LHFKAVPRSVTDTPGQRKAWERRKAMRALDQIPKIFATVAGKIVSLRRWSRFTCGDCERNERCALPPEENCAAKAVQIDRDGENPARPASGYYPAVWPG